MSDPLMQRQRPPPALSPVEGPPSNDLFAPPPCTESTAQPATIRRPNPPTWAYRILYILIYLKRAAIWQVAAKLGCKDNTISQRFSEMVTNGWIRRTDDTIEHIHSGKPCHIYEPLVQLDGSPLGQPPLAFTTSAPSTQHQAQERSDL